MKTFAVLMVATVTLATLIANLGYGDRAFTFLRHVPGGDLTGHFCLYALLSFAVASWISRPTPEATRSARICIAAVLGFLVILEEFSQSVIPTRTFSLRDLAASLSGLLAGLLAAAFFVGSRSASGAA
jgi:VanZ family protein